MASQQVRDQVPHHQHRAGRPAENAMPYFIMIAFSFCQSVSGSRSRLRVGAKTCPEPTAAVPGRLDREMQSRRSTLTEGEPNMAFTLPPLPYDKGALAPHLSAETLELHHDKHHAAYVNNLNKLLEAEARGLQSPGGPHQDRRRRQCSPTPRRIWNHTFYWSSMKPDGGGAAEGRGSPRPIAREFGSHDKLVEALSNAAVTQFGSGWAVARPRQGGEARRHEDRRTRTCR